MSNTTSNSYSSFSTGKKPRVKICGLTRSEDVRAAVDAGADYLGVILAGGPRMQSLQTVEALFGGESLGAGMVVPVLPTSSFVSTLTRSRESLLRADSVGKTADLLRRADDQEDLDDESASLKRLIEFSDPTVIAHLNQSVRIAAVQLHANPSVQEVEAAHRAGAPEIWSVVHIDLQTNEANSGAFWRYMFEIATSSDKIVLDANAPSGLGGSGLSFDWQSLTTGFATQYAELQEVTEVVLAGGLNSMNVELGIRLFDPDIVDVSSGVEVAGRPGVKDPIKIADFIATVKQIRDQKSATDNTVG